MYDFTEIFCIVDDFFKPLKETLKEQGIDLITYPRKNMKVTLLPFSDEFHLRQRKRIETLIGLLKEKYHLPLSSLETL